MKNTWVIMPTKQGLQKRYFSGGKTNPGYPPAHPRSCRAVLPVKAPELGGLSFPFAPRTCTKITAVTMHECSCFLSRELQRAPPLKRGSICSDAKAQWLPCPVQPPPRQFQFYSEQMDFPALGNIPEKKKKEKKTLYCSSNACTRSTRKRPHNVGSVNHYSEGCKTLFWDWESCARTCVRLSVLLLGL